jgi:hypothetical protein
MNPTEQAAEDVILSLPHYLTPLSEREKVIARHVFSSGVTHGLEIAKAKWENAVEGKK